MAVWFLLFLLTKFAGLIRGKECLLMNLNYENIKRIKAYVGGHFGTRYTFEIDISSRKVAWSAIDMEGGLDFEPNIILHMDTESINSFKEALSKCRILSWNNNYTDPHIFDGTQWCLDIEFDHLCIEKLGSNAYPKEWKSFCNVIQKLTDMPFE
jgi:hypothetical protein